MQEIEKDINKCKAIPCCWTRRIHIGKMFILPKVIYQFSAIHIKSAMAFFTGIGKKYKMHIEPQKTLNCQNNLEQEE